MDDDELQRLESGFAHALAEATRWNNRAADLWQLLIAERARRARAGTSGGTVHEIQAQVEEGRRHPERRVPYRRRQRPAGYELHPEPDDAEIARREAARLADLREHWGEVYDIQFDGDIWTAHGHGKVLQARSADQLRQLIRADYKPQDGK